MTLPPSDTYLHIPVNGIEWKCSWAQGSGYTLILWKCIWIWRRTDRRGWPAGAADVLLVLLVWCTLYLRSVSMVDPCTSPSWVLFHRMKQFRLVKLKIESASEWEWARERLGPDRPGVSDSFHFHHCYVASTTKQGHYFLHSFSKLSNESGTIPSHDDSVSFPPTRYNNYAVPTYGSGTGSTSPSNAAGCLEPGTESIMLHRIAGRVALWRSGTLRHQNAIEWENPDRLEVWWWWW